MATDTKHCTICASNLEVHTKISPQDHERLHGDDERACGQCWEAWLSLQVEEKKPDEIECMFCKSCISEAKFMKLAREATKIRYSLKKNLKGYTCMARCKDHRKSTQDHDRERDGRVFTCEHCHFQVCFDCDRPEHAGESCDEYRGRQKETHGKAEALTLKAFKTCPDCNATIEPEKSNCHTQCLSCGYRFCSRCMVNWVGEGGAYLFGKEAHTGKCKYRTRDAESTHSLGNRWQQTEAVQARIDKRELDNKHKLEAKKARLSTCTEPKAKSSRKRRRQDM